MNDEDYSETYGLYEFSPVRKRFITKMIQEAKWNPIFWISLLFTIFSIIALIIHSYWNFLFGALFSAMSAVIGVVSIYLCFLSRFKKPWYQLWKREVARIVFFCIFCLTLQGLFIAMNAELLKNHYIGPEPKWDSFPNECLPNKLNDTIVNCVRTGVNMPNIYTTPGLDPIINKYYTDDPTSLLDQLTIIAESHMNCDHLRTESDWVHFRCLSELLGNPSDLAIRVIPSLGTSVSLKGNLTGVWVHCQSRDTAWDKNHNDYLVRLLFSYKLLCDSGQRGVNCKKTIIKE